MIFLIPEYSDILILSLLVIFAPFILLPECHVIFLLYSFQFLKILSRVIFLFTMSASNTIFRESQLQAIEHFFKNDMDWSLIKFLKYRAQDDNFTYDKRNEHMLYRVALNLLSKEHSQARQYLTDFEVKYCIDFKMSGFKG